ncbi:MAG: NAD(P)-dependent glycerol-1-phosphate dehydrogenase [Methanomassiliicoccaceae archaeon]|nr:NAD(P)-dependent glycerol-1-phosphate dehydrogenase [Methanomassiliicoccaceae archaeon]
MAAFPRRRTACPAGALLTGNDSFTKRKTMDFPRTVLLGHDMIEQVADACKSLQFGKKGVIVTGSDTHSAAGRRVEELMSVSYDAKVVLTGSATMDNVRVVEEEARAHKAKFLLAVGGGSKIDITKMVAYDLGIPFLSIPTSVAHDGIASDRASIKSDGRSVSVSAASPIGIIADTRVINDAPFKYLAAGCADVISNLTALRDWEIANKVKKEEISSSACIISRFAAEEIIFNSGSIKEGYEESVWLVLKPIIASGLSMGVAGSSRPTSGSEHMFSHALDAIRPDTALHGAQCGVGTIMMMKLQRGNWKRVRDALKCIGAPTTAAELGFSDDEIIEALVRARGMREDRYTVLGEKGLTRRAAEKVARDTGVI